MLNRGKRNLLIGVAAVTAAFLLWQWTGWLDRSAIAATENAVADTVTAEDENADQNSTSSLAIATFAGGCFWCVESVLEKVDGVHEVVSGYTGGHLKNPTYREVGRGGTGHTEAVQVHYDPKIISYRGLLHSFWREIDPTDSNGQFVDRGDVYRPAIFYHNEREKQLAIETRDELAASGRYDRPITIEIIPAEIFYEAEGYHQDYYKTNTGQYKVYRYGSGRDQFLKRVWGDELKEKYVEKQAEEDVVDENLNEDLNKNEIKTEDGQTKYFKPADTDIKATLNEMQYAVTQHEGTEPPYRNEYWDNKQSGIYVDVVSGEPLFSSTDKYKSNTGWPSFTRPIDENFIVEKTDYKLIFPRVEVRSKYGDSHLGHLFSDGPAPTGLRYCINSAALRFVAKNELGAEGYDKYSRLFE